MKHGYSFILLHCLPFHFVLKHPHKYFNINTMSQLTWGISQRNKRTLIIDGHDFTKKHQLSLPSRAAINRTLNRQKQNLVPSLPIIKDRHFIIPTEYSDFCLFDSGVMDPERILIFGDRDNVHALQVHNSLWLCDGTFKICPMQFYQLYTIHIQIGGFYPPCLYALCRPCC